jgi:hypothetical protein
VVGAVKSTHRGRPTGESECKALPNRGSASWIRGGVRVESRE